MEYKPAFYRACYPRVPNDNDSSYSRRFCSSRIQIRRDGGAARCTSEVTRRHPTSLGGPVA